MRQFFDLGGNHADSSTYSVDYWRDRRLARRPFGARNRIWPLGDILVGIVGALIASALLPGLGIRLTLGGGVIGAILAATIGAVILLLIVKVIRQLTA